MFMEVGDYNVSVCDFGQNGLKAVRFTITDQHIHVFLFFVHQGVEFVFS